jgi:hypothetical protein
VKFPDGLRRGPLQGMMGTPSGAPRPALIGRSFPTSPRRSRDARHSAVGPRHPSWPPLTVRWRVRLAGTPEAILRLIQNGYLTIALPMRRSFAEAPPMRAEFASAISRRAAIMRGSGRPNWPDIFGIPPCLGLNTAIVVASSPRAWRPAVAKRFSGVTSMAWRELELSFRASVARLPASPWAR